MASLCHPWFATTNLSYRFPIFETSATALCGTTGIRYSLVESPCLMVESQFWADKSVKSPCVILKFTVTHLKSPFLKVKPVKPPFSKEFSPHSLHLPGLHSKGLAQKVLRAEVVGPTWHQGLLRPRTTMVPPGFPNGKYRNIICKWIFNSYWTYWSIKKKKWWRLGILPKHGNWMWSFDRHEMTEMNWNLRGHDLWLA